MCTLFSDRAAPSNSPNGLLRKSAYFIAIFMDLLRSSTFDGTSCREKRTVCIFYYFRNLPRRRSSATKSLRAADGKFSSHRNNRCDHSEVNKPTKQIFWVLVSPNLTVYHNTLVSGDSSTVRINGGWQWS